MSPPSPHRKSLRDTVRAAYAAQKPRLKRALAWGRVTVKGATEIARAAPMLLTSSQGSVPNTPNVTGQEQAALVQTAEPEVAARYPGTQAAHDREQAQQKQWADHEKGRLTHGDRKPEIEKSGAPTTAHVEKPPKGGTERLLKAALDAAEQVEKNRVKGRDKGGIGRGR